MPPTPDDVSRYIELKDRLHASLYLLGTINGTVVLAAGAMHRALLKDQTDVMDWNERRKETAALLNLDMRLDTTLKNAVSILAPMVAAFASLAFGSP